MKPTKQNLAVVAGTTYRDTVRLMQPVWVYKPITSISGAPVQLVVPDHELPDSWPVWATGVSGMPAINRDPVRQSPHRGSRLDANTVVIHGLSATGLKPTGGELMYRLPIDLTGCTVRMRIGDLLLTDGAGLTVHAHGTVERELTPEQTQALADGWQYSFEVEFADGSLIRFFEGGQGGCCA